MILFTGEYDVFHVDVRPSYARVTDDAPAPDGVYVWTDSQGRDQYIAGYDLRVLYERRVPPLYRAGSPESWEWLPDIPATVICTREKLTRQSAWKLAMSAIESHIARGEA